MAVFGAGGGTSSYQELEDTDVVLLWGSNAREAHPIFFHHILRGVRNGARLYAVDPRRTSSAQWADTWLGLDVGSDIALANAIGREIIAAGLANDEFIRRATVAGSPFVTGVGLEQGFAGWIYFLIGPLMGAHGLWEGRRVRSLQAGAR